MYWSSGTGAGPAYWLDSRCSRVTRAARFGQREDRGHSSHAERPLHLEVVLQFQRFPRVPAITLNLRPMAVERSCP